MCIHIWTCMNKQSKIDPAINSAFTAKAIKWSASALVGHHYHSMEIFPLSTLTSDAGMCMLLIDGTCGPAQLRTYFVKITMKSGVTNFICDNLWRHAAALKCYFESISSDDFSDFAHFNDNAQDLAKEFAHFFKTQMIPANCIGNGLQNYDMRSVTHLVHYVSRGV